MNSYATIALLVDNYYDKSYLDNQFSLKADVSQLSGLVSTDDLDLKYTDSVDLTTDYHKKADIDNMLLSYSTGSYVDYNLANKVSTTGDASISWNLDVSKALNSQRHPTESDTILLVIINTSSSGAGFIGKNVSTVKGCWFDYLTGASSTSWWQGISSGSNEFVIKTGSNGLTIQSNGDTTISGNLDVGPSQAVTSIRAYVNHAGHQGNVEIKALWHSQGYLNFKTTNADDLFLTATKDVLYMYCGLNTVYFYKPTTNASYDRLKENEELIEHACETLFKLRPQ